MLASRDRLFTFPGREGVEPTDNEAERALRPAVQWRRISFGNQSDEGMRFTERIPAAARTCRRQGRSAPDCLRDSPTARFGHKPLFLPCFPKRTRLCF